MHPKWYFLAVESAHRAAVEQTLTLNSFRFDAFEGGFAVLSRNPIPLARWLAKQRFPCEIVINAVI